ncbi:MAG TPA: choice-of-anchor D domain-containing protein [Candidatus Kapabacteria bacterium]|nr:choice-of-anchor D domain-containing protein [Candidatus Kapabacteria bacterium]
MKRCVALLILLQLFSVEVIAQTGIPSEGREYYIGILTPSMQFQSSTLSGWTPFYNTYLYLTPAADATVTMTYFDQSGSEVSSNNIKVKAKITTQIALDLTKFQKSNLNSESGLFSTCHLMCTAPISVQFVSTGSCSGGSYLALPIQCYGKHYVVQSYNDNPGGIGGYLNTQSSRGCFQIIAAHDATQISITPSTTTAGGHTGAISGAGANGTAQPFSVALNRGEIYTVYSAGTDGSNDITGTTIDADKPIGVLSGHENAFTVQSSVPSGTEGRDYMVEQLFPVECWDSTGYYTVPFINSGGGTNIGGAGDEVRAVTEPGNGNSLVYTIGTSSTVVPPFKYGSFAQANVTRPVSFQDQNGKPFGVMFYDQRSQGTSDPYPAPSMVSIIPRSRWKSEYYFNVPNYKYDSYDRYLYIVYPKADFNAQKILMGAAGVAPSPINSSVVIKAQSPVPGDDSLGAIAALLPNVNSFYILDAAVSPTDPKKHSTLAAYYTATFSKNRGFGFGHDFFSANDYSEYGNPLGINYGEFGTIKPKLAASEVNQCGKWIVSVHDTGDANTGIRYVEIVNYPKNSYVTPITPSVNARFDPSVDSVNKGEIVLPGTDKEYSFTVEPVNPADPMTAVIEVYDNSGTSLLVNLTAAPSTTLSASGGLTQMTQKTTFSYASTQVGTSNCGAIVITNPSGTGARDFTINGLAIKGDSAMKFQSAITTPTAVKPGTNLSLNICFSPRDTSSLTDTVILTGECGNLFKYIIQGKGASGLINATDYTFAETAQGDKTCVTGAIKNTGSLPFILQGATLSDSSNFSIDAAFLSTLPVTISPGDSITATVCFNPTDKDSHTGTLTWKTNIPHTLDSRMKSVSILNGKGYNAGVVWSPSPTTMSVDTSKGQTNATTRVYLANRGTSKRIIVNSISITGGDSTSFTITNASYGLPITFPFTLNTQDSFWVDVQFKPDTTKGYAPRNSYINSTYTLEGSTLGQFVISPLVGNFFGSAGVAATTEQPAFEANLYGTRLVMFMPSGVGSTVDCSVFDLLGRKVGGENNLDVIEGSGVGLTVGNLPTGVYIVRISSGGKQWSTKIMSFE